MLSPMVKRMDSGTQISGKLIVGINIVSSGSFAGEQYDLCSGSEELRSLTSSCSSLLLCLPGQCQSCIHMNESLNLSSDFAGFQNDQDEDEVHRIVSSVTIDEYETGG